VEVGIRMMKTELVVGAKSLVDGGDVLSSCAKFEKVC
jgi:hypothetical protein